MKFTSLRPILWSKDLQGTIDFYTEKLGFTCNEHNEDWGWTSLKRDEVHLMFATPNEYTPFDRPRFTGTLYFNLDGEVDALWEKWRNDVKVAYPIEDFEYGMREFAIYDNNGYMLQFGQEIESEILPE